MVWDRAPAVECRDLRAEPAQIERSAGGPCRPRKLLEKMKSLLARAQFREDHFTQETKERRADFSAAQSQRDQAVGQGRPAAELKQRQQAVNAASEAVKVSLKLTQRTSESSVKTWRASCSSVTAAEDKAQKALADHQRQVDQVRMALKERSLNFGKDLLTMPILDGFDGPLKDANLWLPDLPWNVNFESRSRVNRCQTCHMGMDRALPGAPTKPAFPANHPEKLEIATPAKPPASGKDGQPPTLDSVYGFGSPTPGVFNPSDVTVGAVYPLTPAAVAGLAAGDVIQFVGDARVLRPDQVRRLHARQCGVGQSHSRCPRRAACRIPMRVIRGWTLYLGSISPHPVERFDCLHDLPVGAGARRRSVGPPTRPTRWKKAKPGLWIINGSK